MGGSKNLLTTIIFLICLCELSWLLMQVVHEQGHVLVAWISGMTVVDVILHPLRISETVIEPKPVPTAVIWAGPVVGSVIPGILWGLDRSLRGKKDLPEACLRFFAGFCLLANGAYLGSAFQMPVGDAFDLVQGGTPLWQLGLFGLIGMGLGLWCWDSLRPRLGIGRDAAPISGKSAALTALALAILLLIELVVLSSRLPRKHA